MLSGKHKEPGVVKHGCEWRSNKKAWITSQITGEWLVSFISRMKSQREVVLLFLEMLTCHLHTVLARFLPIACVSVFVKQSCILAETEIEDATDGQQQILQQCGYWNVTAEDYIANNDEKVETEPTLQNISEFVAAAQMTTKIETIMMKGILVI